MLLSNESLIEMTNDCKNFKCKKSLYFWKSEDVCFDFHEWWFNYNINCWVWPKAWVLRTVSPGWLFDTKANIQGGQKHKHSKLHVEFFHFIWNIVVQSCELKRNWFAINQKCFLFGSYETFLSVRSTTWCQNLFLKFCIHSISVVIKVRWNHKCNGYDVITFFKQ